MNRRAFLQRITAAAASTLIGMRLAHGMPKLGRPVMEPLSHQDICDIEGALQRALLDEMTRDFDIQHVHGDLT